MKITFNKSFLRSLAIVVFVVLVSVSVPVHAAHASECSINPNSWGACLKEVLNALPMAYLTLAAGFATMVLTIASFFLDNLFFYNIILNPTNMSSVIDGWVMVRDIANSLFLLVILWIAIKMIFSIDSDKKLLVRVIIVAFLMNFSLAITGAVFGLANALAKPFADAIGNGGDVAAVIIKASKLQQISKASEDITNAYKKDAGGCGFSSLLSNNSTIVEGGVKLGCIAGGLATDAAEVLGNGAAGGLLGIFRPTISLAIGLVFLLLVTIVFWLAAFLLLFRIIAMVFLGIIAPAAFFLHIIPIPAADALYKRWLKNLIGWAFVAPTFYFLFYLSVKILDTMSKAPAANTGGSLSSNMFAMIPLLVFLAFLSTTLKVSKSMAGEFAQMAIDAGKKVGGMALAAGAAVATFGGSAAMGAIGSTIQKMPKTQKAIGALSENTLLRRGLAMGSFGGSTLATRGVRAFYQKQNEDIDDMKDNYKKQSPRDLTQQFREAILPKKKIAIAEALHEQGKSDELLNLVPDRSAPGGTRIDSSKQDQAIKYARRYGRQENLLKARPDQAVKEDVTDAADSRDAKKRIIKAMKSDEKSRISRAAWDSNPEMQKIILENSSTEDMKQIMRHNEKMYETLLRFFDYDKTHDEAHGGATLTEMRDDLRRFLTATLMRSRTAPAGTAAGGATGGGAGAGAGGTGTTPP